MSLMETIANDLTSALKAGQKEKLLIMRMVKSAIKNGEIEKGEPLSDDEVLAVLRTFAKRAKDSIEQFSKADREDLAAKEKDELAIIEEYLPKQLGEDDLRIMIKDIIQEQGAVGMKDMGKVMKGLMVRSKGQVDGKAANNIVKEMLEV
ncbi:MAG TPA: GatB/YqeY domain-containing protein [Nitrospirae bacterium]|nr:glutamyl-tRNA(Gln) amidotransferase subunit E [bacterium BMS3Abin09]GBE40300.1 glutamyl-tRNA(Gln) amidotransferase subunit E [bacterium BMS3Bbin09]HDZ84110.1 GatB/YqeY domain-containing protein [Nitrospirota bacterium]